MRVKDLMSRQVLTIGTADSCLDAVARMHRARIRHLPVVDEAEHWAFAGTGLRKGSVLPGLLGYEVDAVADGSPPGLRRLGHSPFTRPTGETGYADMAIHESAGGALVFATGSMQWSWGLDGYNAPRWHADRVSAAAQRITRNVLEQMLARGPQK